MKLMLRITNGEQIAFFAVETPKDVLENFRKDHPQFKGRRFTECIQAWPSAIAIAKIMNVGRWN